MCNCVHPTTKKKKHVCSRCRRKIFCTFPFHGWQFFVSVREYKTAFSPATLFAFFFFNIYFCCSRGLLNIYQPQTHWRVRTGSTQVVCLDSQCSRLLREHIFRQSGSLCTVYIISVVLQCPVARVGGGFLLFRWMMTWVPAAAKSSSLQLLEGHEHAGSNICSDIDLPHAHLSVCVGR